MENNMPEHGSGLDMYLSKITSDVVRAALDKVSDTVEIEDVESFLEPLNNESFKDSLVETCSLHSTELLEIKTEEISNAYVHERCSKLIEDTFTKVYDELKRIFNSDSQEMSDSQDIESSKKKLQLLECIKDSDQLQAYFQDLSMDIIQNSLNKIVKKSKHMEPYLGADMESDITMSVNTEQGSESNIQQNFSNNIDKYDTDHSYEVNREVENSFIAENQPIKDCSNSLDDNKHFNIDSEQTNSASTSDFATATNSTMYQTTEGECYNEESTNEDSFVSAKNEGNHEHATVDSAMFTTADDIKENSNTFMSFENELPQDATIITPGRILNLDIDTTLTSGPRQSTPLNDKSNSHETSLSSNEILPDNLQLRGNYSSRNQCTPVKDKPEETETTLSSEASNILPNVAEHERSLPDFSGDESSFGDPSSPRTLSRQSSAFGNVTLEFETDWEASMKGMQEEAEIKPQYEEKHKVILHELSFEDNHRLKAPELLCPVFLAVQDDDDEDEGRKTMKKMSQSIDDLCEMISEDSDDDQDHPLRRRAMSLEGKKPPLRDHRKKAPTREELMAAFEELHHEIMEDKEMEEEGEEEINEEDEEQNRITGGEIVDNQEQYEKQSGVDDPLRWHTVVFNGQHKVIDLKLLEPFLKVLTHGGYHHDGDKKTVIVVLTACNLPDKKMKRYPFLMEQLFFFIISTMDLLVTSEEYIFVYFHGGTSKNQSPSFSWLKKYYQYIDHRLRKSVTKVFVVHPNLWLKSVFRLCRPFLSSNFARKLKFVSTLKELSSHIKTDFIFIPDEVFRVDPDYRKLHAS